MIEGLILIAELTLMLMLLRGVKTHSRDQKGMDMGFFAYLDKKTK